MLSEGAWDSRQRSSHPVLTTRDTATRALLATVLLLSAINAQASPSTTKASDDNHQSNNGVAQASDAPLPAISEQATIGQQASIYPVFRHKVDAGDTPQHGHTSSKPPPHRTAPSSSAAALPRAPGPSGPKGLKGVQHPGMWNKLHREEYIQDWLRGTPANSQGEGRSSQQGTLTGVVYDSLLEVVRRFLPGGGRGGSDSAKSDSAKSDFIKMQASGADHTGRHLLGDGADMQQEPTGWLQMVVRQFLPGGGRGGSYPVKSDTIKMQASGADHTGRHLLGTPATYSGDGADMLQKKFRLPGGGKGGSFPDQMLASNTDHNGQGLSAVAGMISTKSTNTSPRPYLPPNATMHTAVHVVLAPNSSTPTSDTSLAAFEAAAAAAVNKAVETEAASLIAAGIAGLAGVASAETAASTAGSQQMLANITVTVKVSVPINGARPLVAAAHNARATIEANRTSSTEEPLLPASDGTPAKAAAAFKACLKGAVKLKQFNPGAAAHHRTLTKPSKRTTFKERVQDAAHKPSGRKAGAFASPHKWHH